MKYCLGILLFSEYTYFSAHLIFKVNSTKGKSIILLLRNMADEYWETFRSGTWSTNSYDVEIWTPNMNHIQLILGDFDLIKR